jgi:hypothetical protein
MKASPDSAANCTLSRTALLSRSVRLPLSVCLAATAVLSTAAFSAPERVSASWLVQAGKTFQRAGEYTVRRNARLQDAIKAYDEPSTCRVVGSENHAVAHWADRGIWIDAWTYGLLPEGETGCTSPDLIYVSEIRLTGMRWTTSLGLRVGDRTDQAQEAVPARAVRRSANWASPQRVLARYSTRPMHRCLLAIRACPRR